MPLRFDLNLAYDMRNDFENFRHAVPARAVVVGQIAQKDGERGLLLRHNDSGMYSMWARGALRALPQNRVRQLLTEWDVDPDNPQELALKPREIESQELAELLKDWRAKTGTNTKTAETVLGIPARTIEGIEQGRGFPYPRLLILALLALEAE